TADPAARLSSINLLGADDHTRLDGWGNRAVLAETVAAVSIPVAFAEAGGARPGTRCGLSVDCVSRAEAGHTLTLDL
ncbi:hypothetical protein H7H51_11745, partial [Mycolicibacterium farcinogenes]|nr:hypothetical protein [Mycolicibacterium farcinogenes]